MAFVGPRQHSDQSLVTVTSTINLEVSAGGGGGKKHVEIFSSRVFINRSEWYAPILTMPAKADHDNDRGYHIF